MATFFNLVSRCSTLSPSPPAAGASAAVYQVAPRLPLPAPALLLLSATYPVAAASTSSAPAATYPVAGTSSAPAVETKSTAAVETTSSAPAATYPVVSSGNGTTISSQAVKYTTEVVNQYTTYCPGPTQITHGTKTYTVTAPTTLTITDCPCTVSKPVYTTSPPTYNNGTVPVVPGKPTQEAPAPTGGYPTKPTQATTPVAAFGGLLGLVAFAL
ncbi:Clock-controlled protein 6 [Apiospora hydei]|uniref:Clock-controlled protein 6 n=1 Tax=Apiospora hydei TaxID=1337664 RepID=A0ABR1X391_9PEZI